MARVFDDGTPQSRLALAQIKAAQAQERIAAFQERELLNKQDAEAANADRVMATTPSAGSQAVRARVALAQALSAQDRDPTINSAGALVTFLTLATVLADPNVNQYELEVTILITNTVLRGVARMVLGPTRVDGVSWTHMVPIDKNGPPGPHVDLRSTKMYPAGDRDGPDTAQFAKQSRRLHAFLGRVHGKWFPMKMDPFLQWLVDKNDCDTTFTTPVIKTIYEDALDMFTTQLDLLVQEFDQTVAAQGVALDARKQEELMLAMPYQKAPNPFAVPGDWDYAKGAICRFYKHIEREIAESNQKAAAARLAMVRAQGAAPAAGPKAAAGTGGAAKKPAGHPQGAGGGRASGRVGAPPFGYDEVKASPHPAEDALIDAVEGTSKGLWSAQPPEASRQLPDLPPSEEEVLAEKVLKVLKPSLGAGVSNHIQSWASSYVALRLDAKAEGAAFEQDCLRLLHEGCERAANMAIPPLRQWAIGWLPKSRSGQLRAYYDDTGPAVVVFPSEAKLNQAPVEVFGVLGVATEKGDQCGNERDQCLPLSFAAAFPDESPEQVLRELQLGARSAERTLARLSQAHPDRLLSAEAAYANSAAHDLSAGHSHDAHFALYFWPKRLRNVVFVLVKVADRGVLVVDTMDLREKGQKAPVVHFVLMVDGHARPLHFPASWNEGLEGLRRFLLAARNRNVMVNEFQFVGWQSALQSDHELVIHPSSLLPCEYCGQPVRLDLARHDEAGFRQVGHAVSPFGGAHPKVMIFVREHYLDVEDGLSGAPAAGPATLGVFGARTSPTSPTVETGSGPKTVASVTFEDIATYTIREREWPYVKLLMDVIREPPLDKNLVLQAAGPERDKFTASFSRVVKAWDGLIGVAGSLEQAIVAFRSQHMKERPLTMDAERFDKEISPHVPPELAAYGLKQQKRGVVLRPVPGSEHAHAQRPKLVPTKLENELQTLWELYDDFRRGGLVIASKQAEAFRDVWFSPLFNVSKSNTDGTLSDEVRVVHNQSYLGDLSVNGITDTSLHPPSETPTHRTFARRIAHAIVSFPGVPIYMIKRDVSAAFKRVFLQVASAKYFASVVRGSSVGIASNLAVVWLTLSFGWTGSPGEYGVYQNIIDEYVSSARPSRPHVNGEHAFNVLTYVDDTIGFELALAARIAQLIRVTETGIKGCLGEEAVNPTKAIEEGAPEEEKIILGILVSLKRVAEAGIYAARLSLPLAKLQKAVAFMRQTVWDANNRDVRCNDVQKLAGNVYFWATVAPALHLVCRRFGRCPGGHRKSGRVPQDLPQPTSACGGSSSKRSSSSASWSCSATDGLRRSSVRWPLRSRRGKSWGCPVVGPMCGWVVTRREATAAMCSRGSTLKLAPGTRNTWACLQEPSVPFAAKSLVA